ncbi:nitroreductase [Streptomyces umbrinus]|uniref:nitroreductase n=1 Tax=Streptomyces umbrinus TaxID=67370 RepID=UPI0033C8A9F1
MDMYEAVTSRRSVCRFTDRHVPREVLERVLSAAARSSSVPDPQPRRVYVLTGRPLAELEKLLGERGAAVGSPAALLCYVDRDLGPVQWSDVGMYLQTVSLLLRAEGLHSCTRMAWAKYHRTVAEILPPLEGLTLFCGMSIGFEGAAEPTEGAEAAATRSTSTPRDRGVEAVNPAAYLNDVLTRRIRQIMSQIGLPP